MSTADIRIKAADQALALSLQDARIPQHVVGWLKLMRAPANADGTMSNIYPDSHSRTRREWLLQLANDPVIANDPLIHAATLMLAMQASDEPGDTDHLKKIAQDSRLTEQNPLRRQAWLRLADRAAATHNVDEAQTYFVKAGLTAPQPCTDTTTPRSSKKKSYAVAFPDQAIDWGIEGWATLEYDIKTDGTPQGIRPIVAHPPFFYAASAIQALQGARFETSYRPGSNLACVAASSSIRFIMSE